jgi:hypothetical protein
MHFAASAALVRSEMSRRFVSAKAACLFPFVIMVSGQANVCSISQAIRPIKSGNADSYTFRDQE